ncbi:MAG: pyruvate kinase [Cyclobacteriaceae bacterium]|nr:pyruvate kinase [Cyclobacteriaceae bacterium]
MIKIPFNKTKIIATVGPACNTKEKLKELIIAGADVFRLNFSHGTHGDHKQVINYVRELNEELETNICLLQDLQGPKIRVNEVEKGVKLKEGHQFIITTNEIMGDQNRASTSYKNLPNDVKKGDTILIDDGKIELRVEEVKKEDVITTVVYGGKLRSRKGINLPFTNVSAPALTKKDIEDLSFGIENEVEWIALSFVRDVSDIKDLRERISKSGKDIRIIAKIEKPEAVKNIDAIIAEADAIMVARGDLGVEILLEEVPMVQKMIVEKCKKLSKPVIIATQMMESMIDNPRPTRAETNDVANAVMDGADVLMLSAETAAGSYPLEVVKSMVKTINSVERQFNSMYFNHYLPEDNSPLILNDTLILTACQLAQSSNAKAITGITHMGYTAFKIASYRPKAWIIIFSGNKRFLRIMNLIWGVRGVYYDKSTSTDSTIKDIENVLKEKGYVKPGDIFISTASMPIHKKGRANMVKINKVE